MRNPARIEPASLAPARNVNLSLEKRALFSVSDAAGAQVLCRSGCIWLTLDDDPRDVVLEAGQSFCATEHRRALIYAIEASCISVRAAPATSAQMSGRPDAPSVHLSMALQPA